MDHNPPFIIAIFGAALSGGVVGLIAGILWMWLVS
jgi:hypothetical protein